VKFRKKPIVIEAVQYRRGQPLPPGVERCSRIVPVFDQYDEPIEHYDAVRTLEGEMRVSDGDWVICGVKGEYYPCKPDIFEATYEAVED
jgi:hypothetical protein